MWQTRATGKDATRLTRIREDFPSEATKIPANTPARSSLRISQPKLPGEQALVDGSKLVERGDGNSCFGVVGRSREKEVVLPAPEMPVPVTNEVGRGRTERVSAHYDAKDEVSLRTGREEVDGTRTNCWASPTRAASFSSPAWTKILELMNWNGRRTCERNTLERRLVSAGIDPSLSSLSN